MCVRGAAAATKHHPDRMIALGATVEGQGVCFTRRFSVAESVAKKFRVVVLEWERARAEVNDGVRLLIFVVVEGYILFFWLDDAFYPLCKSIWWRKSGKKGFLKRISIKTYQPVFFPLRSLSLDRSVKFPTVASRIPLRKLGPDSSRYGLIRSFFFREKGKGNLREEFFGTFNRWVVFVCGRPLGAQTCCLRNLTPQESNNRKGPNSAYYCCCQPVSLVILVSLLRLCS